MQKFLDDFALTNHGGADNRLPLGSGFERAHSVSRIPIVPVAFGRAGLDARNRTVIPEYPY